MRKLLYLFVLLCKPTTTKGRPWTLSTSRLFVWSHKTSIFTGEIFLQLSKGSYQFPSINFFLYWIINRLPNMQKGRKKSRVVADYGEGNKSPEQSEESIIFDQCCWAKIASGQPDRPQKRGRGEESMICLCFSLKLCPPGSSQHPKYSEKVELHVIFWVQRETGNSSDLWRENKFPWEVLT